MSVDPLVAAFQDDIRKLQQQLADAHKDFLEAINASSAMEARLQQQLADARQENVRLTAQIRADHSKTYKDAETGYGKPVCRVCHFFSPCAVLQALEAPDKALRTEQGGE